MRRAALAALLFVNLPIAAAAQVAGPPGGENGHVIVRAAGMPLRDGALEPGTLTVRIVRGDFSNNVPDQPVDLQVMGGQTLSGRTGSDGRAQFPHVAVGTQVKVTATVDGEVL